MNIVIKIDDVDVTSSIILKDASFETSAMGAPGSCSFRIRDTTHQNLFTVGSHLTLDVDSLRTWGGYITQIHRGYFFDGTPDHCDPLAPTHWTVQGVDYNILLAKRFLYNKTDGRLALTTFDAGTPDDQIVNYYVANHTDLPADGISTSGVVNVGTPSVDFPIDGRPGESVLDFLRRMAFNTGAVFYINPDKVLVFCDDETETAPAVISDHPGPGEVGCRDLSIEFDGTNLRNEAFVWGAGQGSDELKFSHVIDNDSVAEHDLWQIGLFSSAMFRQETVDRTASSYVYGSPQHRRGGNEDAKGLRCIIFEPGFRVAQVVQVRSDVFDGFAEALPIRRMRIDFPTPTQARFQLTISREIDSPWVGYEWWFPPLPRFDINRFGIRLPGEDQFITPDDEVLLPEIHPVCIGGDVTYTGTFATDDEGNSYGFDNPGPFSPFIRLQYNRGGYPQVADPSTLGYLGYNRYLVDGDEASFMLGYRLQTADAVTWDLRIPLPVSGVNITQGLNQPWDKPERRVSDRIILSSRYDDGHPWVKRGDSGFLGYFATHVSVPVSLDQGVTGDVGGGLAIARYWSAASAAPYFSVRNFGTGVVHGGERAWQWVVNEAHLVAHCKNFDSTGPHSSGGTVEPVRIPAPDGEDPTRLYLHLSDPWIEGSLIVYADGLYVPPSEYETNLAEQWISFDPSYAGSEFAVTYFTRGTGG